jgi:uncharacterized protein
MEVDRNGLEVLAPDVCLRLLATATLGRIGVTSGALPTVLPINFRFDGTRILFRTGVGTKLDAATNNAVVAFEVDEIDPLAHTGWSVVVRGVARELTDPDEPDGSERPAIARWAPGGHHRLVAIRPEIVSGRRIVPGLSAPANGEERRGVSSVSASATTSRRAFEAHRPPGRRSPAPRRSPTR